MARRFRRTRRGIGATLEPGEVELVASLFEDVAAMLEPEPAQPAPAAEDTGEDTREDSGAPSSRAVDDEIAELEAMLGPDEPVEPPTDPALARLLPPGTADEDAAADFRRFTQGGLRSRKSAALRTAAGTLRRSGPLLLTDEEAQAWVTALTDVRLVLAERLGLRTDADAEQVAGRASRAAPDDPQAWFAGVYDFLTWMQEGLADVLLRDLPRGGGRRSG